MNDIQIDDEVRITSDCRTHGYIGRVLRYSEDPVPYEYPKVLVRITRDIWGNQITSANNILWYSQGSLELVHRPVSKSDTAIGTEAQTPTVGVFFPYEINKSDLESLNKDGLEENGLFIVTGISVDDCLRILNKAIHDGDFDADTYQTLVFGAIAHPLTILETVTVGA